MPPPEVPTGPRETTPRTEAVDATRRGLDTASDGVTADVFAPGGPVARNVSRMQRTPQEFREGLARQGFNRIMCAKPLIQAAVPMRFPAQIPDGRDPRAFRDFELDKIEKRMQDVLGINQYGDRPVNDPKGYIWLGETRATNGRVVPEQTFYHVNVEHVNADMQLLTQAKIRFPESADVINKMLVALDRLRYTDPSSMSQEMLAQARRNSPANKAMKYAGTLGGVVLLGGASILATISSIVNKQMSVAPLLYAGGLLYLVNPDLLSGKNRAQIQETTPLLGNRAFVMGMAPRYGMAGLEWSEVFSTLMNPTRSRRALEAYDKTGKSQADAENLAKELLPSYDAAPPDVKRNLLNLIRNENHFKALRRWASEVRSPPAKELVLGYIRQGSWRNAALMGAPPRGLYTNPPDLTGLEDLGEGVAPAPAPPAPPAPGRP